MSIRKSSWHQAGLRAVQLFDLPKTWLDPKSQKLARIETWLWHFFCQRWVDRPTDHLGALRHAVTWDCRALIVCRLQDRIILRDGGQRLIEIYSTGASWTVAQQSARFMRDVHYRCIHCIECTPSDPPHHVAPAANGVMAIMMIAAVAGGVNLTIPLPPPAAALNWRVLQFLYIGESTNIVEYCRIL